MTTKYQHFQVPDQASFLESFGIDPVEATPHDGYWCYEITDQYGTTLRLSFNTHERSLQTTILLQSRQLETISQEGATSLEIFEKNGEWALRGEFDFENAQSSLEIEVKPAILMRWSTLVTET
jgi:hypothetical protein